MSYDYNALVSDIHRSCRRAMDADDREKQAQHLAEALETFQTLSGHCPMTPLLWIQHADTGSRLIEQTSDGAMPPEGSEIVAHTQAALQTRLDILELGLQEFPGSAMLHLCRAEYLLEQSNTNVPVSEKRLTIESSLQQIGQGSHLNEDILIHRLYQIHLQLCVEEENMDAIQQSLVRRSFVPLQANQSLEQEACDLLTGRVDTSKATATLTAIERGRRQVAKAYGELYTYGEDIGMQMYQLGIAAHQTLPTTQNGNGDTIIDWVKVAEPGDHHFGMGLGDKAVAHAFIEYALAVEKRVRHTRNQADEGYDDDDVNGDSSFILPETLSVSIYERAVAECPTVESLWLSFIRHLNERLAAIDGLADDHIRSTASALQSVVRRATRNCPESLLLLGQQLQTALVLSNRNLQVLEPDALMAIVNEALSNKFLPADWQFLQAYMMAIRVVKQRVMTLITPSSIPGNDKDSLDGYDGTESIPKSRMKPSASSTKTTLLQEAVDEASDLIEDLDEMYDEVEARLKASFKTWTTGRSLLWRERGLTSQWLLDDLKKIRSEKMGNFEEHPQQTTLSCFEKALRLHNPPHPDSYRSYISAFISDSSAIKCEPDVVRKIRRVRYLYQQAIMNVARGKSDNEPRGDQFDLVAQCDFDAAFTSLCHDWLEFERVLGSDRSFGRAKRAIHNKIRRSQSTGKRQHTGSVYKDSDIKIADEIGRTPETDDHLLKNGLDIEDEPPKKKFKVESDARSVTSVEKLEAPLDVERNRVANEKPQNLKVKVGQMEYPVQPFTVRISFLDVTTEDMDLVDLFQPRCGNVVHARIVRDRQPPHKSKGWALVQFEEKDSVEKALALNDVISLHEKVLRIERSHLPAVSIVPAGRHRIHEKGQGKYSKRNQKKLQQKSQVETSAEGMQGSTDNGMQTDSDLRITPETTKAPEPRNSNSLLLRPRKLARQAHQKSRIMIEK